MSRLFPTLTELAEQRWLPDAIVRYGIRRNCAQRLTWGNRVSESAPDRSIADFARELRESPIAIETDAANSQHYEVPTEFFDRVLGARRKYSCCWFESPRDSLAVAEDAMLSLTCRRAEVENGMRLLDLGCGWGSLTLWLAERYPDCSVTAVSNSRTQRESIMSRARERGFNNVEVITANAATFDTTDRFDRILSIEMFEHMRNYRDLLAKIRGWLEPDGKLFVHVFTHRHFAYPFMTDGNWMGQHFFTGGLMPSRDLLSHFHEDLRIEAQWEVDGRHYQRTSERWLENLDRHHAELLRVFAAHRNGDEPAVVLQRWRIFFLACAELFGFARGSEWGVTHYRFVPS